MSAVLRTIVTLKPDEPELLELDELELLKIVGDGDPKTSFVCFSCMIAFAQLLNLHLELEHSLYYTVGKVLSIS